MKLTKLLENSKIDMSNALDHISRAYKLLGNDALFNSAIKEIIFNNSNRVINLSLNKNLIISIVKVEKEINIHIIKKRFLLKPKKMVYTLSTSEILELRGLLG